jgi:hypothetical protein
VAKRPGGTACRRLAFREKVHCAEEIPPGISFAPSYRTLRDGFLEGAFPGTSCQATIGVVPLGQYEMGRRKGWDDFAPKKRAVGHNPWAEAFVLRPAGATGLSPEFPMLGIVHHEQRALKGAPDLTF